MKTSLVVLAAGMGSRFGGLKQLQPLTADGKVLLDFSIDDAISVGFDEVVFDYFYFPDTPDIVFKYDKAESLASAAKTLVTACSTDSFTLSFVGQDASFPLPDGRTRLYLNGAAAAQVDAIAQQTGLKEPATHLVFLTEIHDTRFDEFSVLRPLDAAH